MKYIYIIFAFIFCQIAIGQNVTVNPQNSQNEVGDNNLYSTGTTDIIPEFPGGIGEFYKYIGNNYQIPRVRNFAGGKVIVEFIIEKDGSVTEIKVLKDLGLGTGEEAIRVLKNCPKWKAGEQNGKKVRVRYALPINLQGNK